MARKDHYTVDQWLFMARESGYRASRLSKSLKVCPRQLQRYIQELFHCSPQHWLNEQRLIEAAVRLKRGQLVKTIALQLGFKHSSHFSREFKLRFGVTPAWFQAHGELSILTNGRKSSAASNFNGNDFQLYLKLS